MAMGTGIQAKWVSLGVLGQETKVCLSGLKLLKGEVMPNVRGHYLIHL